MIPELSDSSVHWAKVYGSSNNSYNLSVDGTAWSAGGNDFGELGDGINIESNVLIKVGTPVIYPALATGGSSDVEYQRGYSYYATNCNNLITEIFKTGGNPIHANTTARVWVDGTVKADGNSKPYVQRHYEIMPASLDTTATGTVRLYFTQNEFTAYNAYPAVVNGTYPKLPIDSNDAAGYKSNLHINLIKHISSNGSGDLSSYPGTRTLIIPASVTWTNGRWQVNFTTTGFGGYFITTGAAVLPITWLTLNAVLNNSKQPQISWKVQEENAASYGIEESKDGNAFSLLTTVASQGDGMNSYKYTESKALSGVAFYRIKQVDKDGRISYSAVISLNEMAGTPALSLFPNPAENHFFINGLSRTCIYHIAITDLAGQVILKRELKGSDNEIRTNTFAKGVYQIKIMTDTGFTTLQFIKE